MGILSFLNLSNGSPLQAYIFIHFLTLLIDVVWVIVNAQRDSLSQTRTCKVFIKVINPNIEFSRHVKLSRNKDTIVRLFRPWLGLFSIHKRLCHTLMSHTSLLSSNVVTYPNWMISPLTCCYFHYEKKCHGLFCVVDFEVA